MNWRDLCVKFCKHFMPNKNWQWIWRCSFSGFTVKYGPLGNTRSLLNKCDSLNFNHASFFCQLFVSYIIMMFPRKNIFSWTHQIFGYFIYLKPMKLKLFIGTHFKKNIFYFYKMQVIFIIQIYIFMNAIEVLDNCVSTVTRQVMQFKWKTVSVWTLPTGHYRLRNYYSCILYSSPLKLLSF